MAIEVKSVRIESNVDQVEQALTEKVQTWLVAVGLDAEGVAANKAPVDTGRLKDSISHAVVESEKAVYIGTNLEYAPYQEFGTSRGVPGKHFIQFGATAHQAEYKALLEEKLKEE